jgi:two-component system sensor histidine kinase DesK
VKARDRLGELAEGPPFQGGRFGGPRLLGGSIWLLFIVFPLLDAIGSADKPHHGLAIAGTVVFVLSYLWLVLSVRFRAHVAERSVILITLMVLVAGALTVVQDPGWGFLFTYAAACAGLIGSARVGFFAVIACAVAAGVCTAVGGGSGGSALGFAASAAGIGLLMRLMGDLRTRNRELTEARAELARLAVAEERERFARDVHDLLGHSLSVIALKAELAGRLLRERPEQARTEMAELESVARQALGEVREAVSGYRQPTLDGELAGARMALSAAGIRASVERPETAIDPGTEAVLAWAVREAATNVIRHSGATRCTLKINAGLAATTLEVVDNGVGGSVVNGRPPGHGLAGLAERARAVAGDVEADALPHGGFRLAVRVPRAAAPAGRQ